MIRQPCAPANVAPAAAFGRSRNPCFAAAFADLADCQQPAAPGRMLDGFQPAPSLRVVKRETPLAAVVCYGAALGFGLGAVAISLNLI